MDIVDLQPLMKNLHTLAPEELVEVQALFARLALLQKQEDSKTNFLQFVKHVWPGFIQGAHHEIMADAFERLVHGSLRRLIINMPPRFSKSEFASHMLPAWYIGQFPNRYIIQASNTADLAVGFGRKVRDLINSDEFNEIFPDVKLKADTKAAGKWMTNKRGEYYAAGVGTTISGKGADLLIIDDPHALLLGTEIPTTAGFKTIDEIVVGDFVFGSNGLPVKVISKSKKFYDRDLYELETQLGDTVICDSEHLWTYKTHNNGEWITSSTIDLSGYSNSEGPYLPISPAVEYGIIDLPIDPYVLGAWLGDGTSSLGRMTSHLDDKDFMRTQFEKAGYHTTDLADPHSWGVIALRRQLIDEGLLNNKHIPSEYLCASIDQRLDLLKGLMDTDGTVSESGTCSFQNTNYDIVSGVKEILNSLGVSCKILTYTDKRDIYVNRHPDFRVNFKMKNAFRLPRHLARSKSITRHRSFKTTRLDETGTTQCIKVDSSDGLFLVGKSYLLTHNTEADGVSNDRTIFDKAYEWYTSGPRQRLQPDASIVMVATRWHRADLTGQILRKAAEEKDVDQWEVIELPAIMPSGKSLWPGYWTKEALLSVKAELPVHKWQAQYQQQPGSSEASIVKRDWWRRWEKDKPPDCEYIIQSWDTGFLEKNTADPSACTTWGVFYMESEVNGRLGTNLILLDAFTKRMEFPDLKIMASELYQRWKPDTVVIEAKASGLPLYFELRKIGVPVQQYNPTRGNNKIARVNAVSDLFSSGVIWAPDRNYAERVIEEFSDFPTGEFDDLVDSSTQALIRFRQGGFLSLPSDYLDSDDSFVPVRADYYS